ncbi:MAG TPA: glycosyltransferase family 39 protein, partial [Candidatus Hydrogenedentes bacterium]|nr:glycosyltransferase family 39 protein [Candidatus Hydrogenedentota bacterium]
MFCKKKTQAGIWTPRAFLLAAIAFSVYYNRTVVTDWMMDDAFVSFRYADNWARGFGPVYNPGEPPVEGYTNFLWVALLTLGARLGGDIVLLSRVLGAAAGVLTLLLLFHARHFVRELDRDIPILAVLFLASFCIFQPWPTSGMETTLFGLLLTFSVLLHFSTLEGSPAPRRLAGLGVVLALTAMTRPEGVLAAGLVLVDQALESLRRRRFQVCWVAGAFLALFL